MSAQRLNPEGFVSNPQLDLIKNDPALIDSVGCHLGRGLVKEKFAEHQLRRIHAELIRINRVAASIRALRETKQVDELKRQLIRLKSLIAYQHARMGSKDQPMTANYFSMMRKLVDQLIKSQSPQDYVELVFNLSESVIAYYNYHEAVEGEECW